MDNLLGAGGELDAGLALIGVVANDGDVVARGTAEGATVADLLLDVGDDGTLRHLTDGKDVADSERSLLTGVDELASVHALVGNEGLGNLLELVGVAEDDLGERSTTTCKSNIRQPKSIFNHVDLPMTLHLRLVRVRCVRFDWVQNSGYLPASWTISFTTPRR